MAPCASLATVSAKNISLLRKPLSSGTPAIAAAAVMPKVAVNGMYLSRPLMRRMSRVPHSWSMMPAAMNSEPKAITSRNHFDRSIPVAAPPAIARSKKPDETMQMSTTAWCLSPKQYASWMAR